MSFADVTLLSNIFGITFGIAIYISIELLYSSYQKIHFGIGAFSETIRLYSLIPQKSIFYIARAIIAAEVLVAIFLLIFPFTVASGMMLIIVGGIFVYAQTSVLARGMKIKCGCHGADSDVVSYKTLFFPIILVLFGLINLFSNANIKAIELSFRSVVEIATGYLIILIISKTINVI